MAEVHVFGRVTNDLQLKMSHKQVPYVSFGLVEWIGRRDTGHRQYFEVWAWGTDALSLADADIRKDSRSSWLIKGNKKKGNAQSRRYQRQATRINCDFTRLVL